jgi:DNA-binding NtrC family response regulator
MNTSILIVEDDVLLGASIEAMVADLGYDVRRVRTGEDALAAITEFAFDLVISDIQLPGINGDDVMVAAHNRFPDLPFILITAYGDVKSAVEAIRNGAFQYLLKPIDPDELGVVVRRVLESTSLRREVEAIRAELDSHGTSMIGRSPAIRRIQDLIRRVARTDSTVLISGETGTGKEVVARAIHYRSPRAGGPLVAFNCAAFNENLMESELFGHERGAFTGAAHQRKGRFEDANGGTIFLDEIGETTKSFQAKLLRVLQEREIERVGSNTRLPIDVRVLASTNRDLQVEVREGRFREDVYYRLQVVPIHIPPLRERKDDILLLADYFIALFCDQYECPVRGLSPEGRQYLLEQPWEGNVRELKHAMERAVVLAEHPWLSPRDLRPPDPLSAPTPSRPGSVLLQDVLDQCTRDHVLHVLDRTGWKKTETAELLGIDRATLYRIIKRHRIEPG